MRTGTIRIVAGGAGKSVPPVLYHIGKTPMDKDMEPVEIMEGGMENRDDEQAIFG